MSKTHVFCIAKTHSQAEQIVQGLQTSGFPSEEISILLPDTEGKHDIGHVKASKAPEGATTGAATGGVTGGVIGLLAGIGALAIPGVGPLIAAGPIMAALSGAAIGGATGGLIGALVGMGIPEFEAKRYEGKLREGNILISVHTEDSKERARAKDVFELAGADDISYTTETAVPKEAVRDDAKRRQAKRRDEARKTDAKVERLDRDYDSDDDADFRAHWQSHYASSGGTYDEYAPAYRYGSLMHSSGRYHDRTWDEIEPEARRDWEARYPDSAWERFKDSVRHGWERLTGASSACARSADRAGRHPAA